MVRRLHWLRILWWCIWRSTGKMLSHSKMTWKLRDLVRAVKWLHELQFLYKPVPIYLHQQWKNVLNTINMKSEFSLSVSHFWAVRWFISVFRRWRSNSDPKFRFNTEKAWKYNVLVHCTIFVLFVCACLPTDPKKTVGSKAWYWLNLKTDEWWLFLR